MTEVRMRSVLQWSRSRVRDLVAKARLGDKEVSVLGRPLTPEEAIGTPGRRDYPIVLGKERILEAQVCGFRGHAFTDSPREFLGFLDDILQLKLTTNGNRAIFVATLNAVLRSLGLTKGVVHCKDDDPEECATQITALLAERYGRPKVGLIGLNPAIAERLVNVFGTNRVRITDLNQDNVGGTRFGVEVWDGREGTSHLIQECDVVLLTGTTLVNGTFDALHRQLNARQKPHLVYGVTAAGVCALAGIDRICPLGRDE